MMMRRGPLPLSTSSSLNDLIVRLGDDFCSRDPLIHESLKWGFPKIEVTMRGGPHNKDNSNFPKVSPHNEYKGYSISGVYVGVPLFWETTK